jgi:hypothetical protein
MGTETLDYEIMPKEFMGRGSQRGWEFKLLSRDGDIAMYEKRSDGVVCYEVIRIKVSKGGVSVIGGVEVEFKAKELYPSDESFGVNGFCYVDRCMAEAKYKTMLLGYLEHSDSLKDILR